MINQGCFFGEYSKEEVQMWLGINSSTPKKVYERVGIELESA